MRTGIFGGTFNPIHNGHIKLAQEYIAALRLDRMLVIPSHMPPHKSGDGLIDGEHRLEMCRLAFADNPRCSVSDIEVRRLDKSYTVDTLEQLYAGMCSGDELYLIMGADMFFTMTQWRDWRRICELAVLCVGAREDGQMERILTCKRELEAQGARCRVVVAEPLVVSSTELRARAAAGGDIRGSVPKMVADYIECNQLY